MDIQRMIRQLKNAHVSPDDGYIKVSPRARNIIIAMLERLKEQPEIVRCGECKNFVVNDINPNVGTCSIGIGTGLNIRSIKWFCAFGTKDGEQK